MIPAGPGSWSRAVLRTLVVGVDQCPGPQLNANSQGPLGHHCGLPLSPNNRNSTRRNPGVGSQPYTTCLVMADSEQLVGYTMGDEM